MHAFLAATPSKLMVVQLEDALGELEQANLPGTTDEHPNWRRKYRAQLEDFWSSGAVRGLCRRLSRLRPRPVHAGGDSAPYETLVPRATYRLQFHAGFTFDDASAILPYLARLGISHVYCSPIQRARPGSMHGYDVVAHDEINPELGGMPAFERFTQALKANGMGQLLDLVPNHMGVLGADNPWWMDVLENGAASLYAQHFDIEWEPLNSELVGKVLVPVLGDHYGDVLDRGEFQLRWDGARGELALHYHEHRFPLAPETYPAVISRAERRVKDADVAASLASIATALRQLQRPDPASAQAVAERARDKELLKARLARLAARQTAVAQGIAFAVDELNQSAARDELHALLEAQAYRLAYWRVAADEINYRRFFDINDLAALRIEREAVFEATHALALDLAARGWVDGLRIDHPDGLLDPARYFERLQQGYALRKGLQLAPAAADRRPARPLYVVAEKIAAPHEEVPESWAVHGTTGYRFANVANGVLVDHRAADRLRRIWHAFTGEAGDFEDVAYHGKRAVARGALASELTVLATELLRIARSHRRTRDYTLNTLRLVLSEVVACLAVYRTYITDQPSDQDLHYIELATRSARRRSEVADPSVFAFVREALLGRAIEGAPADAHGRTLRFATRFQQFSAPVAAKGVEDTAFYRYFPLASLNEVGGDPDGFGMTVAQFHEASADRAARWPHTMLASSTHDNKRSEDVRLRIDVLSEMAARWRLALRRWRALNDGLHAAGEGAPPGRPPSAAHEYLFYQTALGTIAPQEADAPAHAEYVERIVRYMQKAAREGKAETSWTQPNEGYEQALEHFVREALAPRASNQFLVELRELAATLWWYGAFNSLTLVLLKYSSPGVPDLYQGTELMDDSLVDPDNRRPVDYALRAQRLDEMAALASGAPEDMGPRVAQLLAAPEDGRAKLWLIWRLLSLRREVPRLFRDGDYLPLDVRGPGARHVMAFMRRHEQACLVVIAVRLFATLDQHLPDAASEPIDAGVRKRLPIGEALWRDTIVLLPEGSAGLAFEDCITGTAHAAPDGRLGLAQVFRHFPGAVLVTAAARLAIFP